MNQSVRLFRRVGLDDPQSVTPICLRISKGPGRLNAFRVGAEEIEMPGHVGLADLCA